MAHSAREPMGPHVTQQRPPAASTVFEPIDGRDTAVPAYGLLERCAVGLVYAATLYPLVLCFLNTRVARMPNAALIAAEALIGMAALPLLVARLNLAILLLCLSLCANFAVIAMLQQATDLKALRDLLMPVVFVWLGYLIADRRIAERTLRNLAIIAVVLGLVEFVFPRFYSSLFDALAFFVSRGMNANNPFALSVLQMRPSGIGRSLLPFLGPRRISSIFLEPVTFGNFAVLTAAWALSKPREEWRQAAWLMVLAAAMIVMADARFGSITILVLIVARASGVWKLRIVSGLMPVAAMVCLVVASLFGPDQIRDNLVGRMQTSGNNLRDLPWEAWFGIPSLVSLDAGYGYIIQRTGIVACILLWTIFSILPLKDDQARRFHFSAALYASLNLCISGSSLFALKSTAVLWLLLGTVIAHRSMFDRIRFHGIPAYDPATRVAT